MTGLSFNTYQQHTDVTAIYPDAGLGTTAALTYAALGLGEAGEIQNQVKKILRDDDGEITDDRRPTTDGPRSRPNSATSSGTPLGWPPNSA